MSIYLENSVIQNQLCPEVLGVTEVLPLTFDKCCFLKPKITNSNYKTRCYDAN